MKRYDIQRIKDTGQIIRIQEEHDKLTPWGLSDKKPPFEIVTQTLSDEQAAEIRAKAASQGGDGFVSGEELAYQESLKGLKDADLVAEFQRRKLTLEGPSA